MYGTHRLAERLPASTLCRLLLPVDEYERLTEDYDDNPWTREELQSLAWDAGKHIGWEDMDEYDDAPEKP